MSLRRLFFWLHLTAGCMAGVVILIMCITGAMLAYEKQMIASAEGEYRFVSAGPEATRLSLEEILAKVKDAGVPSNIAWHADPASTVELSFGREKTLFVNPYTAESLGEGATRLRGFFHAVEDWHRWLGASVANRNLWRGVTGACNLAFLFMVCSGLYLWMPRSWTWQSVKAVLFFRGGLSGKAREFNWHNVIGLWCCVPLFVVVACAVVMSYPWANNLVYRVSGNEPPVVVVGSQAAASGQGPRGNGAGGSTKAPAIDAQNLNDLCARAERKTQNWQTISVRLPRSSDATATFSIDAGNGGRPDKRAQLTLNRKGGEEVRWEPFDGNNRGRRWRIWIRFAHTGEVFGLAGQTIAGIAALGGAFLVYTGISLALRRFFAWRSRTREVAEVETPAEVLSD
jgi:uncharacterized iron-regulated membrane protein